MEMARLMRNGIKLLSIVTYGHELSEIVDTMGELSSAHSKIDDPPHDMEIQVKKYVYTLLFTCISLKCGGCDCYFYCL